MSCGKGLCRFNYSTSYQRKWGKKCASAHLCKNVSENIYDLHKYSRRFVLPIDIKVGKQILKIPLYNLLPAVNY